MDDNNPLKKWAPIAILVLIVTAVIISFAYDKYMQQPHKPDLVINTNVETPLKENDVIKFLPTYTLEEISLPIMDEVKEAPWSLVCMVIRVEKTSTSKAILRFREYPDNDTPCDRNAPPQITLSIDPDTYDKDLARSLFSIAEMREYYKKNYKNADLEGRVDIPIRDLCNGCDEQMIANLAGIFSTSVDNRLDTKNVLELIGKIIPFVAIAVVVVLAFLWKKRRNEKIRKRQKTTQTVQISPILEDDITRAGKRFKRKFKDLKEAQRLAR